MQSRQFNKTTGILILACSLYFVHCDLVLEVLLNDTSRLKFDSDQFDRFSQCLCNSSALACRVSRNNGQVTNTVITDSTTDGGLTGKKNIDYACPVPENDLNKNTFTCIRVINTDDRRCIVSVQSVCHSCDYGTAQSLWTPSQGLKLRNKNDPIIRYTSTSKVYTSVSIVTKKTTNTNDIPITTTRRSTTERIKDTSSIKENENIPLIAGVISGAVVIVIIIVVIFIVCLRKRRNSKASERKTEIIKSTSHNSYGPNRKVRNSNYEECEIESADLSSSAMSIKNHKPTHSVIDDHDYTTAESESDNFPENTLDDYNYASVGNQNNTDSTVLYNTNNVNTKANDVDDYSVVDTSYSTANDSTDKLPLETSKRVPIAQSGEPETVEYAVVDMSKKTSSKKKPYFDTLNDCEEPNSSDFSIRMADNPPEIPVKDCEYTEVKKPKPKPNPKGIYAKLGEQVRDFKNPYNVE